MAPPTSAFGRFRQDAIRRVMGRGVAGLSRAAWLHPRARAARAQVEVARNVAYQGTGSTAHLMDVYRPKGHLDAAKGRLPALIYVHGGGFSILSKDTHWMMGIAFARRGYVVFNVNYRLAPEHPFPNALDDLSHAYAFVIKNAASYGADVSRLVLAGESAGANLASALTIAATTPRQEPWAQRVFATGVAPIALVPACGYLQVTDPGRFTRKRELPGFIADRIEAVSRSYLRGHTVDEPHPTTELADPLRWFESAAKPVRPLPPTFIITGTRDPILDDSRRLAAALARRQVPVEIRYYPGGVHTFHALVWRPQALKAWRDTFDFLAKVVPRPATT